MRGGLLAVLLLGAATSCTLTETALVPETDALVVEASFLWSETRPNRVVVWAHRSLGPSSGAPVEARVELSLPAPGAGGTLVLPAAETSDCVTDRPPEIGGRCYALEGGVLDDVLPGDRMGLVVTTPEGDRLEGATRLPGSFSLLTAEDGGRCGLPPDTPLEIRWTRAEGASAYLNETLFRGLPEAFAPRGIAVEEDPLALLGLSLSASDTTIVFPGEFGIFDRGDLEQDLAVALQSGLPPSSRADVLISAADQNLVNWLRGGGFNPSGEIRLPSLSGDGTGFFGALVLRGFEVVVGDPPPDGMPACIDG
ncbi:MAG TPA: hypothetical protein RMF84_07545 [Polyangiaceae bacterium LLY-WYZ-14_1]|nr:hypothetical protein [Polyangiaceae bacterium LLY-WYZ-14_1]